MSMFRESGSHVPDRKESRQSQTQRMLAMINAIPAYSHRNRIGSNGNLDLIDEPHQMANGKNREDHAGNAEARCC